MISDLLIPEPENVRRPAQRVSVQEATTSGLRTLTPLGDGGAERRAEQ
ncbi:hypothetical protein B7755_047245 [Streptomyces sp. NBS 14/10]|nr:hypothetical protein [Streptomyces sp. NBS 14/10]KAK1185026.1 hypothetical protein B7755_047245 [Streptomyces sp. NBS 14/10]